MKNKNLLFSLLALLIAGSLVVISTSWTSKTSKYSPRKDQNHQVKYGINGAVEYLASIRNNKTTGDIDPKWVLTAREDVANLSKQKSKSLGLTWNELGPDNVGGRTRAILIDKNDPDIMYAGGVSGGLWKSTTGGSSWVAINDFAENIAVASIAQSADGTIYVGTGEGLGVGTGSAAGSTSFIGKGMYKSTDGVNFALISSTIPTVDNSPSTPWTFINRIACDPTNPLRIYAATNNGLRSTDDGGATWIWPVKLSNGNDNKQFATDVDVATDGTVVTAVAGKCYISPDGDDGTFVNKSTGGVDHLPTATLSRIEMAIAPSNPNYMYACAAATSQQLYNIYRSTDKGETWSIIGPGGSSTFQPLGTQGSYDNTVCVNPTNPDKVYVGGLDMWEWQLGGTWTQKSIWYLDRTSIYYVHADHHFYLFHPTNPNIMFIGSDGGVSRSTDAGETFMTMNINYNTIQSYALACSSSGMIMTGTQDNGTIYMPRAGAFTKHGADIKGGDGGWPAFSYINPEAFFATTYYGGTGRSPDKGSTFYPASDGSSPFFSNRMLSLGAPGDAFPAGFVTPLLMWESFNDTYSSDSITFSPDSIMNEKLDKGVTGVTHFTGTLERGGQPYASIEPGSITIISGSIYVTDNGLGGFTGNISTTGANTIDYATGVYDIDFSTAPVSGANILVSYATKYNEGASILINSNNRPGKFYYTTPTTLDNEDTVKIQDIVQAKFYLGTNSGIWMTKQALNFSVQPEWFQIAKITPASYQVTQCLALSHDGNYLFVGTSNGRLYRLSNLRAAQDSLNANEYIGLNINSNCVVETAQLPISSNSRAITSIAVDPSDANKIIVTLGNYGETNYIYYSGNALDSIPTFSAKQGNLPKMPVYASVIPVLHSGTVLIGTEYGVYSTDDITASSPQWSDENTGLARVPVYQLIQQQNTYWNDLNELYVNNYGTIYAGTHGRGVFECTKYTSLVDHNQPGTGISTAPMSLSLYPNPVVDNATISFTLPQTGNVKLKVYDMTGKLMKVLDIANMTKGYHTYTFDCNNINKGTYFLQMISGTESASAKFVKLY
jgi:hypothetical protein